jgi:adenosylcobinamide-GDP ribazoletransferase
VADGLRLALTTLTVLPVRGPDHLDRRTAGQAMTLAPVVGLLLGLAAAGVLEGAARLTGDLLAAVLAVVALALLTRGLHLDGLADAADGLGSYRSPERALAVMRSPETGPLGIAVLVLSLLVQVAALHACLAAGRGAGALVLAVVTSRLAVTAACTPGTPAASPTGLGALVAGTVRPAVALLLALVVLAAAAAGGGAAGGSSQALLAVVAVVLGLACARGLLRHAVRRLGGVTGDVLGALVETTTAVVLVVLSVRL